MKRGVYLETRKVQVSGGSTFIVSLPKDWIKEMGIKPKDALGFIKQQDGTLLVTPQISQGGKISTREFVYDSPPHEHLLRDLIAAYMIGYDSISVTVKKRMDADTRKIIRKFTQTVIGPEIVY